MKRIGLSLALPVLGLLLGVATPATASAAEGWRGGGHGAPAAHAGGGWHGAPATHAGGGWHGAVVNRPMMVPHVAVAPRGIAEHPGYGWRSGYAGRPGYVGRPYAARPYFAQPAYAYRGPVVGHWGWHGATQVWIGGTVAPYAGWIWTPGTWVWDGYQWVWQDGFWAPPAY